MINERGYEILSQLELQVLVLVMMMMVIMMTKKVIIMVMKKMLEKNLIYTIPPLGKVRSDSLGEFLVTHIQQN